MNFLHILMCYVKNQHLLNYLSNLFIIGSLRNLPPTRARKTMGLPNFPEEPWSSGEFFLRKEMIIIYGRTWIFRNRENQGLPYFTEDHGSSVFSGRPMVFRKIFAKLFRKKKNLSSRICKSDQRIFPISRMRTISC